MSRKNSNWRKAWDKKADCIDDFSATGRGSMDIVGFIQSIKEIKNNLDLKETDTLLDVGCGTGIIALLLSSWVKNIKGIDISSKIIKRAGNNCKGADNISFRVGDIRSLPYSPGSFDKILAYSVLQYLSTKEQLKQAFKEIHRTLKSGGKALFADNPDGDKKNDFIKEAEKALSDNTQHREKTIMILRESLWFSAQTCKETAAEAGFKIKILPVHQRIWEGFYIPNVNRFMFNLLLEKNK